LYHGNLKPFEKTKGERKMNYKQFVWVSAMTALFYCFLWANANPQYFVKSKGIHPIGSQAAYIAGEACIINLEEDSDEKFCAINTPLYMPSHRLIGTLDKCLSENNMTVEEAQEWVVPSHQQCLRLHDQWRRKKNADD
jgi:hypothetical protein